MGLGLVLGSACGFVLVWFAGMDVVWFWCGAQRPKHIASLDEELCFSDPLSNVLCCVVLSCSVPRVLASWVAASLVLCVRRLQPFESEASHRFSPGKGNTELEKTSGTRADER